VATQRTGQGQEHTVCSVLHSTLTTALWRRIAVQAPKISKFVQICSFWLCKDNNLHQSRWSFAAKSTKCMQLCTCIFCLAGEVLWQPPIFKIWNSYSAGFAITQWCSWFQVKTRNVDQCPTWWSPCWIQVAPSVQRRKVWLMPTTRCRAVMLPRRETSWNLQGYPKLVNW